MAYLDSATYQYRSFDWVQIETYLEVETVQMF